MSEPGRPSPSAVLWVVGAAILDDEGDAVRCLAARRSEEMPLPRQWEFPGGKIEEGETPQDALRREIREELAIEIEVDERLGRGEAQAGERRVVLDVYLARKTSGEVRPAEHDQIRWLRADEVDDLEWAEADVPVLEALKARLLRRSE